MSGGINNSIYRAIAFDCGQGVTVQLCPELVQQRTYPEYWFIRRDLHSWDNIELWRSGFRTLYWSEVGWQHHTPKQFTTPIEAIDYHRVHADQISQRSFPLAPATL